MIASRTESFMGDPPEVEVVIEVPRGSFLKRGSTGHIDFVSPLPCPFNYGSVPDRIGREGELLDALVLGPRTPHLLALARARMAGRGRQSNSDLPTARPRSLLAMGAAFILRRQRR